MKRQICYYTVIVIKIIVEIDIIKYPKMIKCRFLAYSAS